MHRITSLARTLDPRLRSHQIALSIAAAAAAAAWGLSYADGIGSSDAVRAALNAGIGAFLAWAIARELDPDRPHSAALAGVVAGFSIVIIGPALLLPTLLALAITRVLNRATGLPPTVVDLIVLVGAAYIAGSTMVGWATGLALAFAVARDHRLPHPAPRRQLLAAFFIAGAASAGAVIGGMPGTWRGPTLVEGVLLVFGLIGGLSLRIYEPASTSDHTGTPMIVARLQSARMGVLGTAVLATVLVGGDGIMALSGVWAVLLAVAIWDRLGLEPVRHLGD